MEDVIYNPAFKKEGYVWVNQKFLKQVNMFDKVIVNNHGTVEEGYIALISRKGVNINLGYGDRFYKWCHVVAVKKNVSLIFNPPLSVGDKVKIVSAMATDWIGKEAKITKVFQTLPQCYELNIGGGHWLHSTLEKIE